MDADLKVFMQNASEPPEAFWQTVVQTMNEALIVVDKTKRIVYSNHKAQQLTGLTLEQARGRKCVDAISCPQCDCTCRLFEHGSFEQREVEIFDPSHEAKRIFLKNGRLLRNTAGEVIGGVETFQDITDEVQQRTDNAVRMDQLFKEKKRYEALIGSLNEGVVSIGPGLEIRDFSARMGELTGYTPDEVAGRNLFELFGLTSPGPAGPDQLASLAGTRRRVELRTSDGRFLPVELIFRPIRFSTDELLGLIRPLPPVDTARAASPEGFHGIVTRSAAMQRLLQLLDSAAKSDINVLIEGESGTGKELVARAIHRLGERRRQPFYAVNCATFTGSLLLSELFGHERGAFTGAVGQKKGKLELAGPGTLFLDEVSEIPIQHQALLLRVLEQRTFERVGGQAPIRMEARIIAATNKSLSEALAAGEFREDLYYRLKVIPIRIPPLRERPEDVELLAQTFLRRIADAAGKPGPALTPEALRLLEAYPWPGNVRELRNLIEYLTFSAGERIEADDLPADLIDCATGQGAAGPECREAVEGDDERQRIIDALRRAHYRRTRAAEMLGVNRSTLYRKMRKLGITA